jgi:hypothetical protein
MEMRTNKHLHLDRYAIGGFLPSLDLYCNERDCAVRLVVGNWLVFESTLSLFMEEMEIFTFTNHIDIRNFALSWKTCCQCSQQPVKSVERVPDYDDWFS